MRGTVEVVDVGLRDGLQNEAKLIATEDKVSFARRLAAAGVKRMEVASFVNPLRVPQMADGAQVIAALKRCEDMQDVSLIGLVLNARGAERAIEAGVNELGCVAVASDCFGRTNQGQSVSDNLREIEKIVDLGRKAGIPSQATVAVAFGCPFEGEVSRLRVTEIARTLVDIGVFEISLADTIGVAVPNQVTALFEDLQKLLPDVRLRGHFHNTRNTGIANAQAAIAAGVVALDASLGGLGGCPFAPKATGNIATEDLVYLIDRSRMVSGLDLQLLIEAAQWLESLMARPLPGMVSKAGAFPKNAVTNAVPESAGVNLYTTRT